MALDEPKLWQILDKVRELLAAIVADGATYFYTPDAVHVVTTWMDRRLWDTSLATAAVIYAVRRADRNHSEEASGDATSGGVVGVGVDVSVLVSQAFNPSSPRDTPGEAQIIERMVRDVLRKLFLGNVTLSGLVTNIANERGADDTPIEDAPDGWAAAQITFRVGYSYQAATP